MCHVSEGIRDAALTATPPALRVLQGAAVSLSLLSSQDQAEGEPDQTHLAETRPVSQIVEED